MRSSVILECYKLYTYNCQSVVHVIGCFSIQWYSCFSMYFWIKWSNCTTSLLYSQKVDKRTTCLDNLPSCCKCEVDDTTLIILACLQGDCNYQFDPVRVLYAKTNKMLKVYCIVKTGLLCCAIKIHETLAQSFKAPFPISEVGISNPHQCIVFEHMHACDKNADSA